MQRKKRKRTEPPPFRPDWWPVENDVQSINTKLNLIETGLDKIKTHLQDKEGQLQKKTDTIQVLEKKSDELIQTCSLEYNKLSNGVNSIVNAIKTSIPDNINQIIISNE